MSFKTEIFISKLINLIAGISSISFSLLCFLIKDSIFDAIFFAILGLTNIAFYIHLDEKNKK